MANPLYIIGSTTAPTDKTTPVNGDNIPLFDSADSNKLKKLSWTNIKATLKTYFDTMYQASGTYVTSVSGTAPVASSGGTTPAISLASGYGDTQNPYASKTANYFLSAPNGSAGAPTFRAIVAADIPTLNQNTTGTAAGLSATLVTSKGGTGLTSFTANGVVYASSTSALATSSKLVFDGTNLGIGATPSAWTITPALQISAGSILNTSSDQTYYTSNGYYGSGAWTYINSDYAAQYVQIAGGHRWYTAPSGSAGGAITFTEAMRLDLANNLSLYAGNLVIGTSGKGIDFSATANATGMTSELLNDYEEGTWTAVFTGSVSSPTYSGGIQTCQYTKIGRVVYLQGSIYVTSVSGGSGNLTITGLPFAPASGSTYYSAGIAIGSNWGTAAPQVIRITGNALSLGIAGNTGAFNATPVSNLVAYADLYFFVSYVV